MRPNRTLHPRPVRQSGFSLVELLLVAFILGVGMLGLAALQTATIRAGSGSRNRDAAAYIASNVLEALTTDGRTCSTLRANKVAIPNTLFFSAVPALDTPGYNFPEYNAAAAPPASNATIGFAMDGTQGPVGGVTAADPLGIRPQLPVIFTANFVVRSNAKGGDPLVAQTLQYGNEVVVNINWKEDVRTATGGTQTLDKWISMSRYIRY